MWRRVQRIWTGRVVKDYGELSDRRVRGANRSLSVVFVIAGRAVGSLSRESWRGFLGFRVNFVQLDRDEATRLAEIIGDAFPRA